MRGRGCSTWRCAIGVSAGEPIVNGNDIHGMAVVIAARLCPAAQPGEILVQDLVQRLVASRSGMTFGPSVDYELKGIPQPVPAAGLELASVPERMVSLGAGRRDGPGAAARARGVPGGAVRRPRA